MLLALAAVAFVQNMAFTWVSRSRNSGDPQYHRWAAVCSNGVWFATQLILWNQIWAFVTAGGWLKLALTGVVYVAATTEGSVLMMKILIRRETGKRKVGA
jgi:hypothetical protein